MNDEFRSEACPLGLGEIGGLDLAQQGTGRHRADVDVNVLESFELRSRRSIREAERKKTSRTSARAAKKAAKLERRSISAPVIERSATGAYIVVAKPHIPLRKRPGVRRLLSMLTASGILTTAALPAYAFSPSVAAMARFTTTNAAALASTEGTQKMTVADINTVKFVRGQYESASAAEIQRQQAAANYLSYSGMTAEQYVLNPPYSVLDEATVIKVAAKYTGTPYVFGGENPNGFDCSGYVRFVFAQFGLDLPHSVIAQSRLGIRIRPEDARPGDLVILNNLSHDGIYAGNGNFYHAPRRGDTVKLAPIFTDQVFFVRLATK